jgi:hypothetical protein
MRSFRQRTTKDPHSITRVYPSIGSVDLPPPLVYQSTTPRTPGIRTGHRFSLSRLRRYIVCIVSCETPEPQGADYINLLRCPGLGSYYLSQSTREWTLDPNSLTRPNLATNNASNPLKPPTTLSFITLPLAPSALLQPQSPSQVAILSIPGRRESF